MLYVCTYSCEFVRTVVCLYYSCMFVPTVVCLRTVVSLYVQLYVCTYSCVSVRTVVCLYIQLCLYVQLCVCTYLHAVAINFVKQFTTLDT